MSGRPPLSNPAILIATWFGVGYLPKAPGTWGSFAALPFAALLLWLGGQWALVAAILLLFPAGIWAAGEFNRRTASEDSGAIVVDEIVGQWLAFLPLANFDLLWFVTAFALFRLFDVWKPWPIRVLDRRIKGGFGVMLDDVLAGIFAALCLWGLMHVST